MPCHAFSPTNQFLLPPFVLHSNNNIQQAATSRSRSLLFYIDPQNSADSSVTVDEALHKELSMQFPEYDNRSSSSLLEERRQKWFNKSIKYYVTVSRMQNTMDSLQGTKEEERFLQTAGMHYFALTKIRNKEFKHAEVIYRKLIESSFVERSEKGYCDHASLAVSTLLLALHMQRQGSSEEITKKTRAVFLRFFRLVGEDDVKTCACSAKVLQAFALFEMKRGLSQKSLELIRQAVILDESLAPILKWNKFEDKSQISDN